MAESTANPDASSPPNPEEPEFEVDADIDMNVDTNAAEKPVTADAELEEEPISEPREPTKKDVSLRDFLVKMDDYAPIVSLRMDCSNVLNLHAFLLSRLTSSTRYQTQ